MLYLLLNDQTCTQQCDVAWGLLGRLSSHHDFINGRLTRIFFGACHQFIIALTNDMIYFEEMHRIVEYTVNGWSVCMPAWWTLCKWGYMITSLSVCGPRRAAWQYVRSGGLATCQCVGFSRSGTCGTEAKSCSQITFTYAWWFNARHTAGKRVLISDLLSAVVVRWRTEEAIWSGARGNIASTSIV